MMVRSCFNIFLAICKLRIFYLFSKYVDVIVGIFYKSSIFVDVLLEGMGKEITKSRIYQIDCGYGIQTVSLGFGIYEVNGSLAVFLQRVSSESDSLCDDDDLFFFITVNLPGATFLAQDEQFVDTNNLPGIEKWLIENNIAEPVGVSAYSGFCKYPLFRFLNVLKDDMM